MAYITCRDLAIGYDGKIIASNINFEIQKGDYLCIVGENGAGKSTLVKTLLHLQDALDGEIVNDQGLHSYEIGYLPQQTMVQRDFPATVWEIVLSGTLGKCGRSPVYRKEQKELAGTNLKKLNMWDMRKRCYRSLSGGQQQRVLLARALCATSKVLLLDEPVTGLDPKITAEFYQLTKELNQKGTAVIMVTHDVHAISYASHVLHVDEEHMFYGTKEQYLKSRQWSLFSGKEGAEE